MSDLKGTNIAAPIAPFTDADTYATHDSLYGKGGWKEVETATERDQIPVERLRRGCACYVANGDKLYRWTGTAWVEMLLGGGGSAGGVTMKLRIVGSSALSGVEALPIKIAYNFTSIYTDDNTETGVGTAIYKVNQQTVSSQIIQQGDNSFDVSSYLVVGTNKVSVDVSDSAGSYRTLNYTVELIKLSIHSTFDASQVFFGSFAYSYTPVGALLKVIHFVVDGQEIGSFSTSVSNKQQSYSIPAQAHGNHTLKVYMTATVNGMPVESNALFYDLICVVEGNMTPIIASAFNRTEAMQYETLMIPFIVYNPALSTSNITLSANGIVVSSQTVDRTPHTWSYRVDQVGRVALKIACGSVNKTFNINVQESSVIVTPETLDLSLYLPAVNRSNADNDREQWSYESIYAWLNGFNFNTNGWVASGDSVALRVSGDARAIIPYKLFGKDFRATGKTIEFEFETRDVTDYEATVISCMYGGIGLEVTAQKALLTSEQTIIETQFKEDERVRVSFVIEKKAETRLLYIYVNGKISKVAQYPEQDNFQQRVASDIIIGSNDCTVDVFNIRIYDNNLQPEQMLNNFIGDIDILEKKLEIYIRNQIYNDYGEIMYAAILEQLPCMILEGELPTYKGDKKTNKLYYTNLQDAMKSFSCLNTQNDVQGTSSQYYPRKNFKFKFKTDITYTEGGRKSAKYALRTESIPVTCFCIKADFAESSGAHNTGMAKIVEILLKDLGLLTPPQRKNPQVRTTIDGFPICLFHRDSETGPLEFVGKYNFNNDKSTEDTFGFTEGCESWEFKNNTSDRVLFKTSDYTSKDADGEPNWLKDFEARYPDDDDLNAEYEGGKIPENLKRVTDWLASTNGDTAKFKNEVPGYFDLDNLIAYYLITEVFAMVDQRAKNMFLTTFDGAHWMFIFYDNDTCMGINNEGLIAFNYNVEYHDKIGTQSVWNGEQSVLWNNLEACFPAEIEAMYKRIRQSNFLSYNRVVSVLDTEQSDRCCEAIYNQDTRFKYIDPLLNDGNGSYLYAAQGSRTEHRKWWAYFRFKYLDSKYNAGDFLSDYATMRLYTPTNWAGVAPNADITITPYSDQYVRVKYGSYVVSTRSFKDVPVTIQAPPIQFNDTETIIYGASGVKSLGNIAALYAGTVDVSKMLKLVSLLIGSDAPGYQNTNLMHVTVGNNRMMRVIDVRNCPNLRQPLDLSGCENIQKVEARGTGITSVVLPNAGVLEELHLPASIANLTVKNQSKLRDNTFTLDGVAYLTTLILENMNNVNVFALIDRCLALPEKILSRVRLINIQGTVSQSSTLFDLADVPGIDENGNNTQTAVVTGKCFVTVMYTGEYQVLRNTFPELDITYKYTCVRFVDPELKRLLVNKYDGNKNGEIDESEANIERVFEYFYRNNKVIVTLEGIEKMNFVPEQGSDYDGYYSGQFKGCTNLRKARIPSVNTKVFVDMFRACTSLDDVVLNDRVTELGNRSFLGCTSLKVFHFPPNLRIIGDSTFQDTGFESVVIPDSVTLIKPRAYNACPNLISVEIGNGCSEVGENTFGYCSNLRRAVIGSGVTKLGMTIFRDCTQMETIILKAAIPPTCGYAALDSCANALIYVPDSSLEAYKTATYFSGIFGRIYPLSSAPIY